MKSEKSKKSEKSEKKTKKRERPKTLGSSRSRSSRSSRSRRRLKVSSMPESAHRQTRTVLASPARKKAAQNAAAKDKVKIVKSMVEIISGSLRLDKRTTITDMLNKTKDKDIEKIYVESVRAMSRDAAVAEEMYQEANSNGIQIVPADIPDLCVLTQIRSKCL